MRILQLCKKFPYPLKDGESLAITYLAKAFHELGHQTTLLAMNTSKHWFDVEHIPDGFDHYEAIHTVDIDNKIRPLQALKHLFSNKSYHLERFVDKTFEKKLISLLENNFYDVIQLETLYLAPYLSTIRDHSSAIIAMRAHNVEHEIWERIAANSNVLKKWYLDKITPRLKAFEVEHLNKYDLMVGISDRDIRVFQSLGMTKKALTLPIGLDCRYYDPNPASFDKPISLSFIGSLDWMPNVEGLRWFLNEVWRPMLHKHFPKLELHIAGRNTPKWLTDLNMKNVIVHGEVPCAKTFLNEHSIMIAPLLSGSGMRAKILEAMALGKVTISTRIGLEGIDATHKEEVLFADTPEEFMSAVFWCQNQNGTLAEMGMRAQVFAASQYDNLTIGKKLIHTYTEMLAQKPILLGSASTV